MAELRENARYIFWSHFSRAKNNIFKWYPRCYGRLKYGKIQRSNRVQNMVYFKREWLQTKESLVRDEV